MKTLRSISTAVLLCLVFAAPAAADELSLSSTSIFPGETVSVTVAVQAHPEIRQGIVAMVRLTSAECLKEASGKVSGAAEEHPLAQAGNYTFPFPQANLYEAFGTYRVCEYYLTEDKGSQASSQLATMFTVVARPVPPSPVVAPASPAPVVAPVSSPPTTTLPPLAPVSKPLTKAQKLHAALAKCKHQKNKHKRVKCERQARKVYKR